MSATVCIRTMGVLLTAILAGASLACGGSAAPPPPPPAITISVSSNSAVVEESTTAQFTASLANDASGQGVKWALSCTAASCGSVSPASTPSGTPTTYTAPGPPAADLKVNLNATAVADPTKSMTIAITVPAISVSLSLTTADVQAGTTLQISGTVNNDASNGNITWTLTQNGTACSPGCGTVAPTSTADGTAATYSAPPTLPASNMSVTITGASATDATKSASATVIVPSVGLSITPAAPNVLANTTAALTATLANDPSNKGVTWTLTCGTPPCGSISPSATANGAATTYSAPPPPASDLQVTITATSVGDPEAMAAATVTVPAITVSVQPPSVDVTATATQQLAATVGNDASNGGVTWACSPAPCGNVAPTSSASGAAVTYTAPGLPASDLTVTVTATSVTDTTKSGTASVTIPAILVSAISPPNASIPLSASQAFTATVSFDPSKQGLNWALTQNGSACSPGCGTVNPSTTVSGAAATFTAPSTLPASASVNLSASSATDSTKSNSATITLTSDSVQLAPNSLTFNCKLHRNCPPPVQNITLTNTGAAALNITGISASSDFSETNTCGTSVPSAGSCTISVTLSATTSGTFDGAVTISDDSSNAPQKVTLYGEIKPPAMIETTAARTELAGTNSARVPPPTGPKVVGTRVLELADTARPDPYLSDGSKRQLAIRLWYPVSSHDAGDCKPAEYASAAVWSYFARLVGVKEFPVATNACRDAAVSEGMHPVILLTPGYTGTFTDYSFLTEDLASRGYVVVAIDHTYEATAVAFSNGKFARSRVGSHLGGSERNDPDSLAFAVSVRIKDLQFVIDELGRLNASAENVFAGRLDLTKIFVIGHSLGGLTALLSNDANPHVKGAILLDPILPDVLPGNTTKPVLILAADRQAWAHNECQLWSNLRGPRLAVSLEGSEHAALSDWIWFAKDAVHTGPMGPEKTLAAVRDYVAAFLDFNVRGEPLSPLLKGPSADYPDARVTVEEQGLCAKP